MHLERAYLLKTIDFEIIHRTLTKFNRDPEEKDQQYKYHIKRFMEKGQFFNSLRNNKYIANISDLGKIPYEFHGKTYQIPYLLIEKIEGVSLKKRLDQAQIELSQILKYAENILEALLDIHDSNYTHWEVIPEKIMICSQQDIAILVSAGLDSEREIGNQLGLSETKINTSTTDFMKMLKGNTAIERGHAVDILYFGILLYRMFNRDTASSCDEIFAELRSDRTRFQDSLRTYIPDSDKLRRQINKIVERTVAKDQRKKYKTIDRLLHDWKKIKRIYARS